jgi:hypothetical protein
MKYTLLFLSVILILVSCGKYEKPFISFRSPEKRLMDKTWKVDKIVKANGNEVASNQSWTFKIEGNDSIATRTVENVTYTGKWNWLPALKGKVDKQRIVINMLTPLNPVSTRIVYDVKVLTSKNLELIDRDSHLSAGDSFFLIAE